MENKTHLFSKEKISKAIWALAIPTIISQLITVFYNMADTFFLGQLGDPKQVAAANISMPLLMFLTGVGNLFGIGGASLISRSLGEGNRLKAEKTASFAIISTLVISIIYSLLLYFLRPRLIPLFGANHETYGFVSDYLFWTVCIGGLATALSGGLSHLVRSEGYAKEASIGLGLGGVLNIILDPLMILGLGWEITGAAVATMISNTMALGYFLLVIYKGREKLATGVYSHALRDMKGVPREVLIVGLPSFVMIIMASISNTAINKLMAGYTNNAVAGMGIAKKINMVAFCLSQGLTQGALPLIGYNYSSGNRQRMMGVIKALVKYSLILSVGSFLLLFFAARPVIRLFIDHAETIEFGKTFLKIVSFSSLTITFNYLIITIFQATGAKRQPVLLSFLRKGTLDVPLMILLNGLIGIRGVAMGTPIADAFSLCIGTSLLMAYLKGLKYQHHLKEVKNV